MQTCQPPSQVRATLKLSVLFILCIVSLTVGCAAETPTQNDTLVGQWQCVDRPWSLKFTEDGQVGWKEIGPVFSGTYSVGPQGGVQIVFNNGDEFYATVDIVDNRELTWSDSNGTKGRFKRLR